MKRRTNVARLRELSHYVTQGRESVAREFTMRVPAEPDRDADLVISTAADEIEALRAEVERLRADARRLDWIEAAADVLAERRRQVEAEGWTPEHDDEHARGEIALAAACYALSAVGVRGDDDAQLRFWPWDDDWWRPSTPRRDLIKAGALILAEIERLDRAGIGKGESNEG